MIKKNLKIFVLFSVLCALYCIFGIYLNRHGAELKLRWLFWNLFLAVLPMALALLTYALVSWRKHWGLISLSLAAGWLLFLPNSCYMITDLIHLESSGLIGHNGTYLMNLKGWVEIIYLGAGIFLAVLVGLFSTSLIHQSLRIRKYPLLNLCWIGIISLLCGYGVYIGRFLRLNSWDILHPRSLMKILLANIDRFTILFSCFIAAFFFFAYLLFDRIHVLDHSLGRPAEPDLQDSAMDASIQSEKKFSA